MRSEFSRRKQDNKNDKLQVYCKLLRNQLTGPCFQWLCDDSDLCQYEFMQLVSRAIFPLHMLHKTTMQVSYMT